VEYALDTISPERTATVSIRDLVFVLKTIREFTTFFSDFSPPERAAIQSFLWGADTGAYGVLGDALDKCIRSLPPDVHSDFCDGYLDFSDQDV
jgi:hypothetical protein